VPAVDPDKAGMGCKDCGYQQTMVPERIAIYNKNPKYKPCLYES